MVGGSLIKNLAEIIYSPYPLYSFYIAKKEKNKTKQADPLTSFILGHD